MIKQGEKKISQTMRTELISAELYALPSLISADSRRVYVACGENLMVYSLKTGHLVEATDAILTNPTSLALVGDKLVVSDDSGARSFSSASDLSSPLVSISSSRIVARCGSVTVYSSSGSTLSYVVGDLSTELSTGVAFKHVSCSEKKICAVLNKSTLFVYDIASGESQTIDCPGITCTAVYESEFAAGDSQGRIYRWSSLNQKTLLHWHATPLSSLCFTNSGSILMSGAEEGVVCMWTSDKAKPQFVPRLGGPIAHISANCDDHYAAISLRTNRIVVVDLFTRSIHSVVQGMALGPMVAPEEDKVAILDPSDSVQIFNTSTRREDRIISLTGRNYLPKALQNDSAAWKCAFFALSSTTVCAAMQRKDQVMMKFYSRETGKLDSVCVLNNPVVGLVCYGEKFISISKNGEIFLWSKNSIWEITKRVAFKSVSPKFFELSTLLLISFGNVLTLWNPETLTELTQISVLSRIVFSAIMTTNCIVVELDGTVSIHCLKSGQKITCINIAENSESASLVNKSVFIKTDSGSLVSVTFDGKSLLVDRIEMKAKVESVVSIENNTAALVALSDHTHVRLSAASTNWQPSELDQTTIETPTRHVGEHCKKIEKIRNIQRPNFPIDMEDMPTPENAFFMLIEQLAPKMIVT